MNKTIIMAIGIGIVIGVLGTIGISIEIGNMGKEVPITIVIDESIVDANLNRKIGNMEKEIPVTIIVDESIADANPNWMNDTRKLVTHSTELITDQKVRFAVVNQITWQPAPIENESFKSELIEKLDKIDKKLCSKKGEIVLIFTREMPKNVDETHDVRSADSANYLMIKYPDYLDEYQNDDERERNYRDYGFWFVESELRTIAIYAINR